MIRVFCLARTILETGKYGTINNAEIRIIVPFFAVMQTQMTWRNEQCVESQSYF